MFRSIGGQVLVAEFGWISRHSSFNSKLLNSSEYFPMELFAF